MVLDFLGRLIDNDQSSSQVLSDEVHVLNKGDPVVTVGVDDLEDFGEEVVIGPESEEEGVIPDQINEVLETESQSAGVFLVLSLDDNFNEEDFKNDSDKFFKGGELILSGFELEVSVNDIGDFTFIQLEDTLQDSFDFIDLKHEVLIDIILQEDLSQLIQNESHKVV